MRMSLYITSRGHVLYAVAGPVGLYLRKQYPASLLLPSHRWRHLPGQRDDVVLPPISISLCKTLISLGTPNHKLAWNSFVQLFSLARFFDSLVTFISCPIRVAEARPCGWAHHWRNWLTIFLQLYWFRSCFWFWLSLNVAWLAACQPKLPDFRLQPNTCPHSSLLPGHLRFS